ncbi:ABC transporter substrate-binding protein [uncultured Thiodictyon sp.]|uniref:ABC transporter substrate-binding protein n=1 Tax=uncultured Thiodictyon sp. TaxID=1846217 RepID=UPI0025D2BA3C|nr:ABC transporter substrate-binding protein [uncultured Thiodictyon sp.]
MKSARSLVPATALVLSLGLSACGPDESSPSAANVTAGGQLGPASAPLIFDRRETLYVTGASWGPASSWNPFQPGGLANATGTIGNLYEFLFGYDPQKGELIPWLAEAGTWRDANTYELKLREGLTWSDGQPLTVADVRFTFELGRKYPALWFAPMWSYLTGITAPDDRRLVLTFKDPLYQDFASNLYNLPIVPEHLWRDRSEQEITTGANERPIGSGAYRYLSHAEDRNVWQRNDQWWGIGVFGWPAPKYLVDIRTTGNNVALGLMIRGELDLSNNFLPGVPELVRRGQIKTYSPGPPYMIPADTTVLYLNTRKGPLADSAFRRALAFAIDVPTIVNRAYGGLVVAASSGGLLPSLSRYDDHEVLMRLGYTYDPGRARQLLAAAGYRDRDGDGFVEAPDGARIALEATCPNGWTDWMAAIGVIASSAQAAGIDVRTAAPDYGAWNTALEGGTFDMTLNSAAPLSLTPWTLYSQLFNHPLRAQMQSGNFGRYDSPRIFELVDALARLPAADELGIKVATARIQTLMLTELPMIPLWYNGLWAQWRDSAWTNWPTAAAGTPKTLPTIWSGFWQLGGLQTLINLKPNQ